MRPWIVQDNSRIPIHGHNRSSITDVELATAVLDAYTGGLGYTVSKNALMRVLETAFPGAFVLPNRVSEVRTAIEELGHCGPFFPHPEDVAERMQANRTHAASSATTTAATVANTTAPTEATADDAVAGEHADTAREEVSLFGDGK